MVRKPTKRVIEHLRGGEGTVEIYDIVTADELNGHGSMYATIKKVLEINEGLKLGGVHRPMPNLIPEDMPKVEAVAARIRAAVARFC